MKQKMKQSSIDFMTSIEVEAARSQIAVDQISNIVIQGLKPNIRQFVLGKEIDDLPSLRKWIAVADTAAVSETRDDFAIVVKDIQRRQEEMKVSSADSKSNINSQYERERSQSPKRVQFAVDPRSPSESRHGATNSESASSDRAWQRPDYESPRTQSFGNTDYSRSRSTSVRNTGACFACNRTCHIARDGPNRYQDNRRGGRGMPQHSRGSHGRGRGYQYRGYRGRGGRYPFTQTFNQQGQSEPPVACSRCGGRKIHSFSMCPAANIICYNCNRRDHMASVCFASQRLMRQQQPE